jgi:hypothetical protein
MSRVAVYLKHAWCSFDVFGKGGWIYVCSLLMTVAFAGLILGAIYAGLFAQSGKRERNARGPVPCGVKGVSVKKYTCSEQDCTGTTDDEDCTTSYYSCWAAEWQVRYTALKEPEGDGDDHTAYVSDAMRSESQPEAVQRGAEHAIGSSPDCWYDISDYSVAFFDKPDATADRTMMIIGFSCAAPFILWFCCFCSFRTFTFFRGEADGYSRI